MRAPHSEGAILRDLVPSGRRDVRGREAPSQVERLAHHEAGVRLPGGFQFDTDARQFEIDRARLEQLFLQPPRRLAAFRLTGIQRSCRAHTPSLDCSGSQHRSYV